MDAITIVGGLTAAATSVWRSVQVHVCFPPLGKRAVIFAVGLRVRTEQSKEHDSYNCMSSIEDES